MLTTKKIQYHDGETMLEAYVAFNESDKKLPGILVAPDWGGRSEFACQKAEHLAQLGYVGFALDMYGKGKVAYTKQEKSSLNQPFMANRDFLLRRMQLAYQTLTQVDEVDTAKIGAMGFCFGGLCVLDLARSGADVKGTVSFHGALKAPEGKPNQTIQSKILVLHGYNDPMVSKEDVMTFAKEMSDSHVDWQITMYSNTMHAFTNPEAKDPGFGTVYQPESNRRAMLAMQNFFQEIF